MADRVLIVSSRFPWPPVTGDRGRVVAWLEALAPRADVTLVAPDGRVPAAAPPFRFVTAHRSAARFAAAALRTVTEGLPATAMLAAGYDWTGALEPAEREWGPFDAAVVLLARLDPWVFPHLRQKWRILDAIDSLAGNMEQRARAARGPARVLWRLEARRTARLERSAAARYDRVLVIAESERAAFGERSTAIFHGVRLERPATGPRDFDVGFWGRLAYFANRDAAAFLLEEIWPRIRRARPDASLVIAGADAPAFVRRQSGREGITVISPMADRSGLLRRVRVALFPVRFGSGQSTRVPEAAEASCALVATPEAVRGLDAVVAEAFVEIEPERLAARVLGLLADPAAAAAQGERLRLVAEREFSRVEACRRLADAVLFRDRSDPGRPRLPGDGETP
jgi:glycosyltransferase involved in cell wall biosynthesis